MTKKILRKNNNNCIDEYSIFRCKYNFDRIRNRIVDFLVRRIYRRNIRKRVAYVQHTSAWAERDNLCHEYSMWHPSGRLLLLLLPFLSSRNLCALPAVFCAGGKSRRDIIFRTLRFFASLSFSLVLFFSPSLSLSLFLHRTKYRIIYAPREPVHKTQIF